MINKIFIFGGTTEGRQLAQFLGKSDRKVVLSVATSHGTAMVENLQGVEILEGRLTTKDMKKTFVHHQITHVVDATHPFAVEVSNNIRKAVEETDLFLFRLIRKDSTVDYGEVFSSEDEVVSFLNETEGNVLLTTGSKTLEKFTEINDYKNRVYPRILPMVSSVEKALQLGYHPSRIIALQGPFSAELNSAVVKEYNIVAMVTKDSGDKGGFPEKVESCIETGIQLLIIRRPEETGYTLDELEQLLIKEGSI